MFGKSAFFALALAASLVAPMKSLAQIAGDAGVSGGPPHRISPVYGMAVLSEKHRLSRRRTLDVAELADEPLLLLHRSFATREWFDAACNVAHVRPRVLLESAAPHAVIPLAAAGYGVAVVPSTALILGNGFHAVPLIQRGAALGRWLTIAWAPQRLLSLYAEQFAEELVAYCRRAYPGREFTQRAPALPRPKDLVARYEQD